MAKQVKKELPFDDKLILFKYFLSLLGKENIKDIATKLAGDECLGYDENNNTLFYNSILIYFSKNTKIKKEKLKEYDENICRYVKKIGEKRDGIELKYFQYVSLLFTEMYLDGYFNSCKQFIKDINEFIEKTNKINSEKGFSEIFDLIQDDGLNKLCFMCATGSGKTLIMHINILQYLHYFTKAKKSKTSLELNRVILLTPNEGLSNQHLREFELSGIHASLFMKDSFVSDDVCIIDINKLKETNGDKTVAVDSFESNNLVLVDEGHRGLSGGEVWFDYRTRLSENGFSFEYSATFKQALKSGKDKSALIQEYGKSIIMDYSYKYFYSDGYGKDYRILNLKETLDEEKEKLYLMGCLLSFYQQSKVYALHKNEFVNFCVEKPLLVFVGNRVNASTSKTSEAAKGELSDVENVLHFIDFFTSKQEIVLKYLQLLLNFNTGIVDSSNRDIFHSMLNYVTKALHVEFHDNIDSLYIDILKTIFDSKSTGRLHICNLKQVNGEIALKIGESDKNFGVISVGDTNTLIKHCDEKGLVTETDEFVTTSLFNKINTKQSDINILIGSRKFTEGWSSWRVSTMGLINFGKSEGSQAIQLFGRGVRLKGHKGCLKRSNCISNSIEVPFNLDILEKLIIFGLKADYMTAFKEYLEAEDLPGNDRIEEIVLPVISRYDEVKDKKLKVLRLPNDKNFKKQGKRISLSSPTGDFEKFIYSNKVKIDCYSKTESLSSQNETNPLSEKEENSIKDLDFLDYERIYLELLRYKNEKNLYNITIKRENLNEILKNNGWYTLYIPENETIIDSMYARERNTDIAIMLLKGYLEKFYKYHKSMWEQPLLQYEILEDDDNFIEEYVFTYNAEGKNSTEYQSFQDLRSLIADMSNQLSINYNTATAKKNWGINILNIQKHLFNPLIAIQNNTLNIELKPVSLTESERKFVEKIEEYCTEHSDFFINKEMYLLRNKSKTGTGFFATGGFYPDFILWIIHNEKQYITFVDPKGILLIGKQQNNPKIEFYKTIKEIEKRIGVDSNILNSFILSITEKADIKNNWNVSIDELEDKNVLFLEEDDCIQQMIDKILR